MICCWILQNPNISIECIFFKYGMEIFYTCSTYAAYMHCFFYGNYWDFPRCFFISFVLRKHFTSICCCCCHPLKKHTLVKIVLERTRGTKWERARAEAIYREKRVKKEMKANSCIRVFESYCMLFTSCGNEQSFGPFE